jgi:hypothetical protein
MTKMRTQVSRRGLSAMMMAVKPHTREEKEFVRAFAGALAHATAVVAAEPGLAVSAGSIAHQVKGAVSRLPKERRDAVQERAKARLSGPAAQRQRYFGPHADRGADAWADAAPGLDTELKRMLRDAVRARVDFQSDAIADSLAVAAAAAFKGGLPLSKTTLEVGYFSGEAQVAWTTLTISSPITIELRWETNAPGAERGVWQLFHAGGQQEVLLGSGHATDAPAGIFTIDLANYLPASPPNVPAVYRIRVTPGTKPHTKQVPQGQVTAKVPGKAVGPPSNDVVITYSAIVSPDIQIQIFEVYHTATFVLESIHMVEDQSGPGAEEFHVAGFVQETFPPSSAELGGQQKFGPFYAVLDPDGPKTKSLLHSLPFFLAKPDAAEWPRIYTAVISVLEEDDGGSVNDWQSSLWETAESALSGATSEAMRDLLEEKFKDFVGDNIGELIEAGGQAAQTIASLIGSTTSAIVGMVVAAAALVISDIVSGMDDDYYGTEVFALVLPTNITDFVHTLDGQAMAGGYKLDTEFLEFKGYTSWPEATAWDGMVRVYFHWEFTNKGQS